VATKKRSPENRAPIAVVRGRAHSVCTTMHKHNRPTLEASRTQSNIIRNHWVTVVTYSTGTGGVVRAGSCPPTVRRHTQRRHLPPSHQWNGNNRFALRHRSADIIYRALVRRSKNRLGKIDLLVDRFAHLCRNTCADTDRYKEGYREEERDRHCSSINVIRKHLHTDNVCCIAANKLVKQVVMRKVIYAINVIAA